MQCAMDKIETVSKYKFKIKKVLTFSEFRFLLIRTYFGIASKLNYFCISFKFHKKRQRAARISSNPPRHRWASVASYKKDYLQWTLRTCIDVDVYELN